MTEPVDLGRVVRHHRAPGWEMAKDETMSTDSLRLTALENPPCCKGGPQWGHDWDCPTLP